MEIPIQQIRRNSAGFTLVRTVFFRSNTAKQTWLFHKPPDSLVIHRQISVARLHCDAAIAVSSSVLVINCCNLFLDNLVFIWLSHPFQMIIKGSTWQLSDWNKNFERISLSQFLNYQRFLCWRRSYSKTKACNFLGIHSPREDAALLPADFPALH